MAVWVHPPTISAPQPSLESLATSCPVQERLSTQVRLDRPKQGVVHWIREALAWSKPRVYFEVCYE